MTWQQIVAETLVNCYQTRGRNNPEDIHQYIQRRDFSITEHRRQWDVQSWKEQLSLREF